MGTQVNAVHHRLSTSGVIGIAVGALVLLGLGLMMVCVVKRFIAKARVETLLRYEGPPVSEPPSYFTDTDWMAHSTR
jgi:hypothetical protein